MKRMMGAVMVSAVVAGSALGQRDLGQGNLGQLGMRDGGARVSDSQFVRPAGESLSFEGRPVDVALSPDGSTLFAKDDRGLIVIDAGAWRVTQRLSLHQDGTSVHGIAVSGDGHRVYLTDAEHGLHEASLGENGSWAWTRNIDLAGPDGRVKSYPCGVALSGNGVAYVCLSRNNTLAEVDLASGEVRRQIAVGVAPYGVVLDSAGALAVVSNWAGRRARAGDRTATSAGTPVVVDDRDIAASGSVSIVDLKRGAVTAETEVGLHPGALLMWPHGSAGDSVLVACANSDRVVAVDLSNGAVLSSIDTRIDPALPIGSSPESMALSADLGTLYVANSGDNALAVIDVSAGVSHAQIKGAIPTAWYPGSVLINGHSLYIANVKGFGSRAQKDGARRRRVQTVLGTVQRVRVPSEGELAPLTERARADARHPEAGEAMHSADHGARPAPVPSAPGEPSVFHHIVYVIKENRTYDQVFGDMGRGNGDPSLCIYGREVTPNEHAIAEQFVLLDNFYCNSVKSSDGHAWVMEGNVVDYVERAFGGFTRNYDWGEDPMGFSGTGAIWDHALAKGLSVRNFGEADFPETPRGVRYGQWLSALDAGKPLPGFRQRIPIEHARAFTSPNYPGWNLGIPDVARADAFLKELGEMEHKDEFPNLCIVYLPDDHTSGTSAGWPTPRSYIADNDLALGRVVEGISKSKFWPETCIFVVEDDPQDGFDHVDGHRSTCMVVSPYARRHAVVSQFYNQASVVHTIERMLGIAPANRMYALAPVMTACFEEKADPAPFAAVPNRVPLGEMNPDKTSLTGDDRRFAEASERLRFDKPDLADEDSLNRVLWHSARGRERYPVEWVGAHGRGLAALGLAAAPAPARDDDDDDR